MIVKGNSENFENAPTGTHIARCIGLIDIGTHTNDYKGNPIRRRQVIIKWELPLEERADGQPFVVSQFYTLSLSEKANLRADLVNWRGKEFTLEELQGFDLKNILDVGCQVTVTEKENKKIKVSGVTGLPKGVELPPRHNELVHFDLDFFDQKVFDSLSDGLKKMIQDSEEYQAEFGGQAMAASAFPAQTGGGFNSSDVKDDDVPF